MPTTEIPRKEQQDRINPVVFYTSAALILIFTLTTIFYTSLSDRWINNTLEWVSNTSAGITCLPPPSIWCSSF